MVRNKCRFFLFLLCLTSCVAEKNPGAENRNTEKQGPGLAEGVSRRLAEYRKKVISNINYRLELAIPALRTEKISAWETVTFQLKSKVYPLQLDFREETAKIKSIRINGRDISVQHLQEHIIIAPEYLLTGNNQIDLKFEAGEGALNRNADYLYTLFVPDRARTVFPCFDQPDLKATYTLSLSIPRNWQAIANGMLKDSVQDGERKTLHFAASDTLSTYLFAFAAGRFDRTTGKTGSGQSEYLYRETDSAKIRPSVKAAFDIHHSSLEFLEQWTGIPYPFQKFGFVAIPDFQFGGMEHPGAIQYKSSAMFLDAAATKDQLHARSNVIAHETAHMWFGDLVTMNWFSDVWMKEVFANFMADKSAEKLSGKEVFDLKFLVDHFPAAYGIDRTTGSNPIRQDLDNLKDAGSLYGNIIYHKAPVMMRQLERLMGEEKFQAGVREYLHKFANGNASWPDLIGILDKYADADLQKWNKVWVNDTGRPVFDYSLAKKGGKISRFLIRQTAEHGQDRIWPQLFEIKLCYPGYSKELTIALDGKQTELKAAVGLDEPLFVLFNSSGQGYGLWPVDTGMLPHVYELENPLNRASAYISLYENMLAGRSIRPGQLLDLLVRGLGRETEELNVKLISGYISSIYWGFTSPAERLSLSAQLENRIWSALESQSLPNIKKILFKTYQDVFLTGTARDRLYAVWKTQQSPAGLRLTEDDYTSLAFSLALRDDRDSSLLKTQLLRIGNADRKIRFEFIMPALSPLAAERDDFFKRLEQRSNREKEANVATALSYLHHPLRQASSIRYLPKSLDLLKEIQVTGDIFFPQNWLQATFGSYQSPEAAEVIRQFLQQHPDYNPKLRAKILQSADNVFKAELLLKK